MWSLPAIPDREKMDQYLIDESKYILGICRKIQSSGCNVLLVQRSEIPSRPALDDITYQYLADMGILVIDDLTRSDIEYACLCIGCKPCSLLENFTSSILGEAELVEEHSSADGKFIQISGMLSTRSYSTILCRGGNSLLLAETERALHDAVCVVRSLLRSKFILPGGGAPEIELSLQLATYAKSLFGSEAHCVSAFASAMEIIPYTLAENAGLQAISVVTDLRNHHNSGEIYTGLNINKVRNLILHKDEILKSALINILI
jgi:T-complex protein 1 subunit delta